MVAYGRKRSTHTTGGPASGIESSIAAGACRSARRHGSGSATKKGTFTQKMPGPSEESYRRHPTKRKDGYKGLKVNTEHRREHRSREAGLDSKEGHVYPRERRSKKETKPRYEEVRRLGQDEEDDEAEADEKQDERDVENERRRRAERSKSNHHHHHHQHHKHHHHHRQRVEEERPTEHRSHCHKRTPSEQREHDERKAEKRAARAEREEREARDLPPSSKTHRKKHVEPIARSGLFSGLFKRTNSTPTPAVDRPQTRRSFSEPQISRARRERDECDEGLPIVPERSSKHRHKKEHEKRKKKPTGFLGMFIPAAKEPKIEAPVKLVTCMVCLDDEVKSTRAKKLKCGHRQCHSCLRRGFKLSLTDPQQMPPKCCTSDPIPLRAVDKLFPDHWKKKWNRKYEEYTTKNRIYCPAKKCGEWVRPEDIKSAEGKKQGICRKCKTKVCGTCNAKWHGARDCHIDSETKALLKTAREAGWQRCYRCRTLVELREGCNHMTCRCKAEFCMLCGLKWRTCECSLFNYETIEADQLAHMRVPGDIRGGRPPPPPHFPRNMPNAFAAFFPPPRPVQREQINMAMPPPPIIGAFQRFDQNLIDFGANFNTNQGQVQERASQCQERLRQQRQDLHQQQQFDEPQQRMRANEGFARNMQNLHLATEQPAPAPRQRRRQESRAGSEAQAPAPVPASVQAGIARGHRGSWRVNMWMENVPFQPGAEPVR